MPKKTPTPNTDAGAQGVHRFVSCTKTTLLDIYTEYTRALASGKPVWTWAYAGNCGGGTAIAQFVALYVSMSGKKMVVRGNRTLPDESTVPVTVTVGPGFIARVDDGEPKPNIVPWVAFVASAIAEG